MKFQPDTLAGTNVIARQEPTRVWVAGEGAPQPFEHSLVVPWRGTAQRWLAESAGGFDALDEAAFERLLQMAPQPPEVVVFGSGARLRFVRPALLRGLIARRIGVETMDTPAACRTYNVLAAEGRQVLAALLLEADAALPPAAGPAGPA